MAFCVRMPAFAQQSQFHNVSIVDISDIANAYIGSGKYSENHKPELEIRRKETDGAFDGWWFKEGNSYKQADGCTGIISHPAESSDTTYYPVNRYSITYNYNGGSVANPNPSSYNYFDNITVTNPTKNNYWFYGWNNLESESFYEYPNKAAIPLHSKGNKSYNAIWGVYFRVTGYNYDSINPLRLTDGTSTFYQNNWPFKYSSTSYVIVPPGKKIVIKYNDYVGIKFDKNKSSCEIAVPTNASGEGVLSLNYTGPNPSYNIPGSCIYNPNGSSGWIKNATISYTN